LGIAIAYLHRYIFFMAKMLTTADAAAKLRVNDSRVRQLIRDGRLPSEKFGHIHMIRESDLAKLKIGKPGRPKKSKG
jgi:excisionase family DNA binding protein